MDRQEQIKKLRELQLMFPPRPKFFIGDLIEVKKEFKNIITQNRVYMIVGFPRKDRIRSVYINEDDFYEVTYFNDDYIQLIEDEK